MANIFDFKANHDTYYSVRIGSTVLKNDLKKVIVDVSVEDSDEEAKLCRVTVQDVDFKYVNNKYLISEGLPIEVTMGFSNDFEVEFSGFVTHVEQAFDENFIPNLVIGATNTSDLMYRLYTEEFTKIKRSDLVVKLAKRLGYKAVVQATTEVVDSIKMDSESIPKFLAMLADDEGYVCSIVTSNKTIYFHSRMHTFGKLPLQLHYGYGNYMIKKVNAQAIYKNKNVIVSASKAGADGTKKDSTTKSTVKTKSTQVSTPVTLTVDGVTGGSRISESKITKED